MSKRYAVYSFEGVIKARWLSWLERRPVTAEVVGSSPIRVACTASAYAGMAELADAQDLKSCGTNLPYRFDSGCRHERKAPNSYRR